MLKTIFTIAALLSASGASAATVTFASDDTFTVRNTSFTGFTATLDPQPDAMFNAGARLGPVTTTTFDDSDTGFITTPQFINISATYMGITQTQSVEFSLLTRNNSVGAGAKGAQSRFARDTPFDFVFADGTFTLERFIASVNCLGCAPGETRGSNALIEASFAPAPGVIPLPAGFGLLLTGLGAFGVMRRRKKSTATS